MAKLYFRYSTMNAGKSLDLLKVAFNYEERGQKVLVFTSAIDSRYGVGKITSRIGIQRDALVFNKSDDIFEMVAKNERPNCILVDEAQFLTKDQVFQLTKIVDVLSIPIICYGLRADFLCEPFEGSKYLMAIADTIEELKTICDCGKKAIINMRLKDGKPVFQGNQVEIGGNDTYKPVCRKCYRKEGTVQE